MPYQCPGIVRFSHRPDSSAEWSICYEHISADRGLRVLVGLREQLPVAPDGSIEWLSLPRPDSPSVFGALLDRNAGSFRFGPVNTMVPDHRRYVPGTMVLETTWHTPTGWLVVNDLFVVRPVSDEGRRAGYQRVPRVGAGAGTILRTATCISGKVDVTANCLPMFDYGSAPGTWSYDTDGYHSLVMTQPDGDVPSGCIQLPARPSRCPRLRPARPP